MGAREADQNPAAVGAPSNVAAQVVLSYLPVSDAEPSPAETHPAAAALSPAQVFSDHVQDVARLLRRMGVAPGDLEDQCQEVFLVVLRRLPEFRGDAALRTWLYAICWRTVQGYRRARARRARHSDLGGEPAVEATQERAVHARACLDRLQCALDALDEARRAIFVLYEVEGLPMREVVEVVGCPLQTGYSRLKVAREAVRAAMIGPTPGPGQETT